MMALIFIFRDNKTPTGETKMNEYMNREIILCLKNMAVTRAMVYANRDNLAKHKFLNDFHKARGRARQLRQRRGKWGI